MRGSAAISIFSLCLVAVLGACGEDQATPAPQVQASQPVTVEVTRTVPVTVEVTKLVEVTKVVTVLVTAPAPTQPPATPTVKPAATPTAQAAPVALAVNSTKLAGTANGLKPKDGFTFFIVDVTITNNTAKTVTMGPNFFTVQSDQNYSYEYSFDASFKSPKFLKATDLVPNETNKGELIFEVPTAEKVKTVSFFDGIHKVIAPIS